MDNSRIHNKWPVAREGFPFILVGIGTTGLFLFMGWAVPSIIFGSLSLFTVYFFRDPDRNTPIPAKAVVAPADGKIVQIKEVNPPDNPSEELSVKISIFMSVFNVHVNRIPISGTIRRITYYPGKFLSANLDKASEQNEHNVICLELPDHRRITFVQIAGLIARRIACWVGEGEYAETGQRFGLIRFGSRVDIYLPRDTRIVTQLGHKVSAGRTIIGYMS